MTGFTNQDGSSLTGGLLPTNVGQALSLDAAGNLKVIAGNGPGSTAVIIGGQAYSASTGALTAAAGTNNYPLALWNASSSGKSLLIYSLHASISNALVQGVACFTCQTTTNPAYGSSATPANQKGGGAASVATVTYATTTQAIPANTHVEYAAGPVELLTNQNMLLLPAGNANGITAFLQSYAAGSFCITARWLEF